MALPTEKDVDRWLNLLGSTDEAYAQACASLTAQKERLKVSKAMATPRQGTQLERENEALMSPQYSFAIDALKEAEYQKKLLELKREQYMLGIEVYRTLSANQRRA